MIQMTITDDGGGLSAKTLVNPGIGLQIMQYRARMIGATLSFQRVSAAGGTIVRCTIPAAAAATAATPASLPAARESREPSPLAPVVPVQHQES